MKQGTIDLRFATINERIPKRLLQRLCNTEIIEKINRYPENYPLLIERLAKKHRVKQDNITLVNGVDEGIELIARVFGQNTVTFIPTFYELIDATKRNGFKIRTINCLTNKKWKLSYTAKEIRNGSLVFVCNPNNPLGILTRKEIMELVNKAKGIVAIDETYIDFNGVSSINQFKQNPNILVLRSFSKGYCLAGLRIGYVIGDEKLIRKIKKIKLPFNVTSFSVNAALIALDETKCFKKIIDTVLSNKESFEHFLVKSGFDVIKNEIPKILIRFKSPNEARRFQRFLFKNRILITLGDSSVTYGLGGNFIQFGCGTKKQMAEVKRIVSNYFKTVSA